MPLGTEEIRQRFTTTRVDRPSEQETLRVQSYLEEAFVNFADFLDELLSDSRDKSLALTALEEAATWGQKSLAREQYELVDVGLSPIKTVQLSDEDVERDEYGDPLTFEQELIKLINKHGIEKYSNTADYVLTEFVRRALLDFANATDNVDNRDPFTITDYCQRALKTFDIAVRLRSRQGEPGVRLDVSNPEDVKMTTVPLVDRTGETPTVIGEAQVVEKHDGYHIEATLPSEFTDTSSVGVYSLPTNIPEVPGPEQP